jgi:hypothetical protein
VEAATQAAASTCKGPPPTRIDGCHLQPRLQLRAQRQDCPACCVVEEKVTMF